MLKCIIFDEETNVFIKTKLICFKISNKLQFCLFSMFSIYEIALQNANFEIVNVVTICIEMQWQKTRLFLSDRVCVIIKSVSEISTCFSNMLCFCEFFAMN